MNNEQSEQSASVKFIDEVHAFVRKSRNDKSKNKSHERCQPQRCSYSKNKLIVIWTATHKVIYSIKSNDIEENYC